MQTKLFQRKPDVLTPKATSMVRRVLSVCGAALALLAAGLFARLLLRVCLAI